MSIEPTTFRFVEEHLNHCATAVPNDSTLGYTINNGEKCLDLYLFRQNKYLPEPSLKLLEIF